MEKFLIPLVKRGESGPSQDNVLWQNENVYVMDNHRLALWCWFQKMEKGKRYNLLHIDAHPDLSESALLSNHSDLWSMSLDDYRNTWQKEVNLPLFRWDNYIEIFLKKYPELVGKTVSATHFLGSNKSLSEEIKAYDLAKFMREVFSGKKYVNDLDWIVNLDLDYFFSAASEKLQLFSDEYIQLISEMLHEGLRLGGIKILTIALSPECCGSWEKAEMLLGKISEKYKKVFR